MAISKSSAPAESRTSRYLKQAGVVLGLISGVVGLLFLLFPGLRPEAPGASRDRSATVSGLEVDGHATRGQYLDYSDQSKTGLTKAQLAQPGATASFKLTLVGYKSAKLTLQRQLVDLRTGNVIGKARDYTLEPTRDAINGQPWWDWVPLRPGSGSYVMVFKLFAEPNAPAVECKQTDAFGGVAGQTSAKPSNLCPG